MLYHKAKRILDIIISVIAIFILIFPLIPIMIGLKLTGEGEIWFFQERIGYKNKPFTIWKFASMLKNSDKMKGGYITTTNDPRFTPMGPFLRKTKINELPQLINVLKGEMSIVGPRPVMEVSYLTYPQDVQKILYNVKPGLTGFGSIIFRDEEVLITKVKDRGMDPILFYKEAIYPFKGTLEKYYQDNYGFMMDLKIFIATIIAVFFPSSVIVDKLFPNAPKKDFDIILSQT